ncbi:NADH-hydrate epimerase [Golovinomyces cichoracearum]|uniref:NAD(P)H-hydrate epimerase n=1 Tax=Golovinomyces cichoracearum TaxID=62708 RepID=A0A420I679_9PEZI|nr:NADH-hydrate epimerase [Golovinomyces cichoracearum]
MGTISKYLSASNALALDKDLMSHGGFSIDQLMELAGLSVSQVIHHVHPQSMGKKILIACGPGNNGGDGLVAARHLKHYGYQPIVYYPKRNKSDLFQRLQTQLDNLNVTFTDDFLTSIKECDHVIDASHFLFSISDSHTGFSFSGEVREPFPAVIKAFEETSIPVTSVDVPSSWDVEKGPPKSGIGSNFKPSVLVSLSAPKPLASFFRGRHFVGGRFVPQKFLDKYGLENYDFQGVSQMLEIREKQG